MKQNNPYRHVKDIKKINNDGILPTLEKITQWKAKNIYEAMVDLVYRNNRMLELLKEKYKI